jgi:hypothetical protein
MYRLSKAKSDVYVSLSIFHDFNVTQQASMSQHSLTYEHHPTATRTEVAKDLL